MRKSLKSLFALGCVSLIAGGCATIHRIDSTQYNVIPASQLIEHPSKWKDVVEQMDQGKTVIIKLEEGQRLPLRLTIDSPVSTIEKSENVLRFKRDLYYAISKKKWEVSPDGQRFASVSNLRALKKLFGFSKGSVSVGFKGTESEGTYISVELKAVMDAQTDDKH